MAVRVLCIDKGERHPGEVGPGRGQAVRRVGTDPFGNDVALTIEAQADRRCLSKISLDLGFE